MVRALIGRGLLGLALLVRAQDRADADGSPTISPRPRRPALRRSAFRDLHAAIGLYRPAADKGVSAAGSSLWQAVCPSTGMLYTARLRATSVEGRSSMPPPPLLPGFAAPPAFVF